MEYYLAVKKKCSMNIYYTLGKSGNCTKENKPPASFTGNAQKRQIYRDKM
jgi:hypothetical protein